MDYCRLLVYPTWCHPSGTGIKVYGRSTGTEWVFTLDGNFTTVILNSTDVETSASIIFRVDNMTDGDHELSGSVQIYSPLEPMFAAVDFIECVASLILLHHKNTLPILSPDSIENSSGGGFDLLNAGSNAKNVPKHAVIVDNNSLEIIYDNTSKWSHDSCLGCYERSFSWTVAIGGSLSYSFDGVAIWYGFVSHTSR